MAPVDAHRDPLALLSLIQKYQVTTLHFVPSMLAVFENAATEILSLLSVKVCQSAECSVVVRHYQQL